MTLATTFVIQPKTAARRWSIFRPATSLATPYPSAPIQYGNLGAGEQAEQLRAQVAQLFSDVQLATPPGWQVPTQRSTNVALSGLRDAEWVLDEDERKF